MFNQKQYMERMQWYVEARFGMFIHFGLYSNLGIGEWARSNNEIPLADYSHLFNEFTCENLDFRQYAKLAKQAGMKYVVLTAKHHEGFCLFNTKTTDYNSVQSPAKRDLVKEFVEAVRDEGLKVGLYYSLIDWYQKDYPHYGDRYHPERNNPKETNENRDFNQYLKIMHTQVKELVSNYGKLDILWFDFSYDQLKGEAWKASELLEMVRSYQKDVIIDNRLETTAGNGYGSLYYCNPVSYHGDFQTPEQMIPLEGIKDIKGNPSYWEACITMNDNWGYHKDDFNYKPVPLLIHKLVECVSKGGNMILNVGPKGDGSIPEQSIQTLQAIGAWMNNNSESIYGCGYSSLPKPENGRITQKGKTLYFHTYENSIGPIPLVGIRKDEIDSIELLATHQKLEVSNSWICGDWPDVVFVEIGNSIHLPDPIDTIIKVILK